MKTLFAGVAAVPLLLGLLVYATGLAVVDIRQDGPGGQRLIIPVPLALANTALFFVDEEDKRIECPEFAPHHDAVMRLARELQRTPDARFVEIEDSGQHVTIDKSGNLLLVEVHDDDKEVSVRVPISALESVIESYDGRSFAGADVLAAIREAPSGEFVRVHDGEDHVRIWVW